MNNTKYSISFIEPKLWNEFFPFCNQRLRICFIAESGAEKEILKFGTKNA